MNNLDWIKVIPSVETPINKNFFYELQTSILNLAFPIGKTEIFYDNEDHSNYMGFTWERTCTGKVPVGIDSNDTDFNAIGKTGGEKAHVLTIAEMPSHSHNAKNFIINSEEPTTIYFNPSGSSVFQSGNNNSRIGYTGGNQSHNNLQPYQVVAFWKRIA